MFFGQKLKECRLEYANQGLRKWSHTMGMIPSDYHRLERGFDKPPEDPEWYLSLLENLKSSKDGEEIGIEKGGEDEQELFRLWKEPFVMQKMSTDVVVSPLAHKSDGTRLTTEEYLGLNEHINL